MFIIWAQLLSQFFKDGSTSSPILIHEAEAWRLIRYSARKQCLAYFPAGQVLDYQMRF
jgi:hypothetical protein